MVSLSITEGMDISFPLIFSAMSLPTTSEFPVPEK
jgi:hypothetical protein